MKFYTVREIADILKVSKTTIQKAIKAAAIEFDKVEKNKQYYSYQKAKEIIKNIRPDFDFSELENQLENLQTEVENSKTEVENQSENSKTEVENSQTQTENSKTEVENSQTQQNEQMAALNRMLDMIQKQLEEKDKQLAIKDKQIQDLNDRLAEAMELTRGQQYITAADKTAQLMEKSEVEDVTDNNTDEPTPAATKEKIVDVEEKPPHKKSLWNRLFSR